MTVAVSVPERFNAAPSSSTATSPRAVVTASPFVIGAGTSPMRKWPRGRAAPPGALRARRGHRAARAARAARLPPVRGGVLGAIRPQAVPVPLDPGLRAADYAFFVEDSRARAVVTHPAIAADFPRRALPRRAAARPCWSWAPAVRCRVLPGRPRRRRAGRQARRTPAATTWRSGGYTSGSTGRPKAAVHSSAIWYAPPSWWGAASSASGPTTSSSPLPSSSSPSASATRSTFPPLAGAASVLVPERLDAERTSSRMVQAAEPRRMLLRGGHRLRPAPAGAGRARAGFDLGSLLRLCVSSEESLPAGDLPGLAGRGSASSFSMSSAPPRRSTTIIANRPGASRAGRERAA